MPVLSCKEMLGTGLCLPKAIRESVLEQTTGKYSLVLKFNKF